MMHHRRAPGVQHGGEADPGAKTPGISGDRHRRFGGGPEQRIVDDRLVLPGDVGDIRTSFCQTLCNWTRSLYVQTGQPIFGKILQCLISSATCAHAMKRPYS